MLNGFIKHLISMSKKTIHGDNEKALKKLIALEIELLSVRETLPADKFEAIRGKINAVRMLRSPILELRWLK